MNFYHNIYSMVKTIVQVYNDSNGLGFTAFLKACAGLYIFCKENHYIFEITYTNSCLEPFLATSWNKSFVSYQCISSINELQNYVLSQMSNEIYLYCFNEIEWYYQISLFDINIIKHEVLEFIINRCLIKTPVFQNIYETALRDINISSFPYIVLYIRTPDESLDDVNLFISISLNSEIEQFIQFLTRNALLEFLIVISTSYKIKKEIHEKFNVQITPTVPVRLLTKNIKSTDLCPSNGIIDFFILMNASVIVSLPIGGFHGGYAKTAFILKDMDYYESLTEFQENFVKTA